MLLSAKVIHVFTLNSSIIDSCHDLSKLFNFSSLSFLILLRGREEKNEGGKRIGVFEFPSNTNVLRFLMHQSQVQSLSKLNLGICTSGNNFLQN